MSCFYGIDEDLIKEYARLIVRTGINTQKGQEVIINCPVEYYEFGHMLIEEAYAAGAGEVIVRWNDSFDLRQLYLNASDEVLATVPDWKADSLNYYADRGVGQISISGSDPEAFKGVDHKKIQMRSSAMDKAVRPYYDKMVASAFPWTVAAVPQKKWAEKVFPDMDIDKAMESLWRLILQAVRIGDGDAVKKWDEHDKFLKSKCAMLNEYEFEKLHYENSIGTDFIVGLAKNHIWEGGSEVAGTGTVFEANMPTEEIFTMPDCHVAEGRLVSALPLSHNGNLIKNFSLTFKDGKVTEYTAEEGYEVLQSIIDTDEGSKRLGEVAIVPYTSTISQMNTLFYNTLFDENASCHFALGECYPTTVKGGEDMDEEELLAAGGNSSINHVDFMVGTVDLKITGIKSDGSEVLIFENGDWVK